MDHHSKDNLVPILTAEKSFESIFSDDEELSYRQQELVLNEMVNRLIYFADCGYSTFLPLFGILFPVEKIQTLTESDKDTFNVKTITYKTIEFEKTDEILTSHKLQFPKLLELRELADSIYERIKKNDLAANLSQNVIKKYIRKFWRNFRNNLVLNGYDSIDSIISQTLCRFFCNHNRQGTNEKEWFAGADISILPKWKKIINETYSLSFERPVLVDSTEITNVLFGDILNSFKVNLKNSVLNLGYELDSITVVSIPDTIKINSYIKEISTNKREVIFCTDGIRQIAINLNKKIGNEFIIKVPLYDKDVNVVEQLSLEIASELPYEILTAISAGALLASISKSGVCIDASALDTSDNSLEGAVSIFDFQLLGQIQKCNDIDFYFKNLVHLKKEESYLIENGKKSVLTHYLKHKGYLQHFSPSRPSVLKQTSVL